MHLLQEITQDQLKDRCKFKVGDGVAVHSRIREGNKERIQIYSGIVIAIKGSGIQKMFTVRHMSEGNGVERIFPLHSPSIVKIEVKQKSVVMRAKLYYLRGRVGKDASKVKIKEL